MSDGSINPRPPRERRSDGASAWRCALQKDTPGARRLHWWRVPAPGDELDFIEFAQVGHHDDYSIPE